MVKSFPNQKEYLKKYLSGKKHRVKKNESSRRVTKGVKLIDDDETIKSFGVDDDDFIFDGEDAPQIVFAEGVEPSVIKSSLARWKKTLLIEENSEKPKFLKKFSAIEIPKVSKNNEDKFATLKEDVNVCGTTNDKPVNHEKNYLEDQSPPRRSTNISRKSDEKNRKNSPFRKLDKVEYLTKEKSSNSDLSPERKHKSDIKREKSKNLNKRRSSSSDMSPPRTSERRSPKSRDLRSDKSSFRNHHSYRKRRRSSSDRRSLSIELSPKREYHSRKYENEYERNYKTKLAIDKTSVIDRPKIKQNTSTFKDELSKEVEKTYNKKQVTHEKVIKMASGKDAGLRTAKDLKEEMKIFRKNESEMFSKLSTCADEFSEPNFRSNVRNKVETPEETFRKKKKEEDNEKKREVYNKWGKGLKQIESHKTKILEEEYESSKPLARYANDKDLDDMLKCAEREGDPMLEYLRNKKEKERVNKKGPELPIYKGSYSENRFGIRPGYRWDGVDRSNGYEKKYFEKQNVKRAQEEEAYRYSTEDM